MNKPLLILIALLVLSSCKSQAKPTVFHPIVLKAKETSLYTNQVNWQEVNEKFLVLSEGKNTTEELKPALQYLINVMGDKHGAFRLTKDHSFFVSYNAQNKDNDPRDSGFITSVINDITATFSYELLENNLGYLKVVAIGQGDVKSQADLIRNGLKDLKIQGVYKWIVDLRFNGGGNIEPMISGLAPLIGEGFIGGGINSNNDVRPFKIENGQFYNFNRLACPMDNLPKIGANEKVAVLLSRYTTSSGEMLAIAFKGRDNTKFIGEPTSGYTTGNGYDVVSEELVMIISQDVFIDRNKVKYKNRVGVDEFIEFQHTIDMKSDDQINRAIQWLSEN